MTAIIDILPATWPWVTSLASTTAELVEMESRMYCSPSALVANLDQALTVKFFWETYRIEVRHFRCVGSTSPNQVPNTSQEKAAVESPP